MVRNVPPSDGSTLKSPSSHTDATSKPDKDKGDKDKDKATRSSTDRFDKEKKGAALAKFLSKSDMNTLRRAKEQGGEAWDSAKAKIRLKLTPTTHKSKSARANTAMPVQKLKNRLLQSVARGCRATTEAAVALASALDYSISELVDNSCQACEVKKQKTITARHIKLGVPQDASLAELFKGVTIPQGGTLPFFHPELAQGYRKRKQSHMDADEKISKELSSPKVAKKGFSEVKPMSSGEDPSRSGTDPKKLAAGKDSTSKAGGSPKQGKMISSPAEK